MPLIPPAVRSWLFRPRRGRIVTVLAALSPAMGIGGTPGSLVVPALRAATVDPVRVRGTE